MSDARTPAETPFWRFSLELYGRRGIAEACIALQDGFGVDVNLLLFLFWLASAGWQVSADDVRGLDGQVRSWRELTIVPIRNARRKLKGAATLVTPGKQESFRDKVKAVELEAERLQQEALYELAQRLPLGVEAPPPAAARANIAAYESVLGLSFPAQNKSTLIGAFDAVVAAAPR